LGGKGEGMLLKIVSARPAPALKINKTAATRLLLEKARSAERREHTFTNRLTM